MMLLLFSLYLSSLSIFSFVEEKKYILPIELRYSQSNFVESSFLDGKPRTIAFYLQDGVEVLDFAGPMEVFAYAGFEVFTVSKTKEPITSQGILTIIPDYDITDAPESDILVLFGGNYSVAAGDPDVIEWIKKRQGVDYFFSICTGAFILAEAGLLDGQKATTFHNSLERLKRSFPEIEVLENVRFVDNGKVITTAGISAGIDGALHMVAKLEGLHKAKQIAYHMEYDNWVPGDGLILSADNPYIENRNETNFDEYKGTYENQTSEKVLIKTGSNGADLSLIIDDKSKPLFWISKETFCDAQDKVFIFRRDAEKKLIGYYPEQKDMLYKKKRFSCTPCGLDCDTSEFTSSGRCPSCAMEIIEKTFDVDFEIENEKASPSCTNEKKEEESIKGLWQSLGSGWLLDIKDNNQYSFYDITNISCLPNREGKFGEVENSLSIKNDTLSLLKGVITYKFTKTEQLPELCQQHVDDEQVNNPLYNFEVFAETIKEHYAFMELNQINWSTLYQQQKNKLDENSTDAELYLVIQETLENLNDNHAFLSANQEVFEEIEMMNKKEDAGEENLPEIGDFQIAKMVTKHHLEEEKTEDSWLIQWGKLNDSIGYIQIKAMWLYADLEIPESLIDEVGYVDAYVKTFIKMYEGDYIDKEVQGVRVIMDKVMKDLSGMGSIVIDVRFNGGGQDAVSFEILSRFTPKKLQVATQKLRYGNNFSPSIPLFIEGTPNAYTKPVYVLTSRQTGSAAEAFAIATISMENVKRIGASTSGAMSTALEKSLPNGWAFSISNEIFMDNYGRNYENEGIPANYNLNYPEDRQSFFRGVADDLERDKQNILNAIEELEKE